MRLLLLGFTALALTTNGCASLGMDDASEAARAPSGDFAGLDDVLAHVRRDDDRVRDGARHPDETLRFFDVQPTHTVAEYAPGGGWYTRILAPYVAEQGRYVAVSFAAESVPIERVREALTGWDEKFPTNVEKMTGVPADRVAAYHSQSIPDDAVGTVDRILVPRIVHNLLRWNISGGEIRGLRKLLKDDGLLGIVQHRAPADASWSYGDGSKGYLRESDLLALMAAHGFTLVDSSEINANPNDTANYEAGVWTLPPALALGDEDKERYVAIGESDRATLVFRKSL